MTFDRVTLGEGLEAMLSGGYGPSLQVHRFRVALPAATWLPWTVFAPVADPRWMLHPRLQFVNRCQVGGSNLRPGVGSLVEYDGAYYREITYRATQLDEGRQQLLNDLDTLAGMVGRREEALRSSGQRYYLTAQLLGCDDD